MTLSLLDKIDAVLPQTQCGECQYDGCRPYAEALASGQDTPNHCPPGGIKTLRALGSLLNIKVDVYESEVAQATRPPSLAIIREDHCIGCTKCISACPVDAIVGSAKHMHTVIEQECTGCGLCVEPCPVDCIDMIPDKALNFNKDLARNRYEQKRLRAGISDIKKTNDNQETKKKYILEAIKRSSARRGQDHE